MVKRLEERVLYRLVIAHFSPSPLLFPYFSLPLRQSFHAKKLRLHQRSKFRKSTRRVCPFATLLAVGGGEREVFRFLDKRVSSLVGRICECLFVEWNGKWRVPRSFDEVSFPGWRSTIFGYRRIVFGARNSSLENVYIYIYGKYGILTLDRFHVESSLYFGYTRRIICFWEKWISPSPSERNIIYLGTNGRFF